MLIQLPWGDWVRADLVRGVEVVCDTQVRVLVGEDIYAHTYGTPEEAEGVRDRVGAMVNEAGWAGVWSHTS